MVSRVSVHCRRSLSLPVIWCILSGLVLLAVGRTDSCVGADSAPLQLTWSKNLLTIEGPQVPGDRIEIWYLEAFCRAGSTDRDWNETVIPHTTALMELSDNGRRMRLKSHVRDGVEVTHEIIAKTDEVAFTMVAHNPTTTRSEVDWAQPCVRVDRFTGCKQETYLPKCFVVQEGRLVRLPTSNWATQARYTPGQVWAAPGVDRRDVNPRPLHPVTAESSLMGCYSSDETKILAVAFEPCQELFQGVITCIHSDIRIGGLAPHESKTVRGKLYLLPADERQLLERFQRDFPASPHSTK